MEKSSSPPPPPPTVVPNKVVLTDDERINISKEDLLTKYKELESYISHIEENGDGKSVDEKLKLQQQESTRRENVLVMRLATKEQEMQELLTQIQELKRAQTPATTQLQTMLIDPAVNLLFEKMKTELTETKERLEQAQNDLSAWKFTPDSVTGKKLMAKCRMLIQENQDLGKQLSQGRIAQLEAELALQKKYSEELKGSQDEMNEFVIQLDEEVEGMQATICALQQQLKETKRNTNELEKENSKLKELVQTTESKPNGNDLHTLSNHHSPDYTQTNHINHELKPGDEAMDVDISKQDLSNVTRVSRTSEDELNSDSHPLTNQVTVIRGTDENMREVDAQTAQYLSPTKGLTKTSFSINDLLSSNSVKTDAHTLMEVAPDVKTEEENGTKNGLLNGEIDDAVI